MPEDKEKLPAAGASPLKDPPPPDPRPSKPSDKTNPEQEDDEDEDSLDDITTIQNAKPDKPVKLSDGRVMLKNKRGTLVEVPGGK